MIDRSGRWRGVDPSLATSIPKQQLFFSSPIWWQCQMCRLLVPLTLTDTFGEGKACDCSLSPWQALDVERGPSALALDSAVLPRSSLENKYERSSWEIRGTGVLTGLSPQPAPIQGLILEKDLGDACRPVLFYRTKSAMSHADTWTQHLLSTAVNVL